MESSQHPKRWADFSFEKLKSLWEEFFFIIWGGSPYGWDNDNGTQAGGGGHNIGQNNYYAITSFQKK